MFGDCPDDRVLVPVLQGRRDHTMVVKGSSIAAGAAWLRMQSRSTSALFSDIVPNMNTQSPAAHRCLWKS